MINFVQRNPIASLIITVVFLLLYQSLNLFWGFDVIDSGYHLTAFQNVFEAPECISANFCYYLTNLVGGGLLLIFPDMGVTHFRIIGAICVLIAIFSIFFTLWKDIPVVHILMGSALVVICYVKAPYSFNNGILSCLLYVIALLFLYKGIKRDFSLLVFACGFVVGLNIFTRIPNILGVGLSFIILFHRKIFRKCDSYDWKNTFCFVVGAGFGVGLVLLLMRLLGHFDIFTDSIRLLFSSGVSKGNNHSFSSLILSQLSFVLTNVVTILVFYALFHIHKKVSGGNVFLRYLFCTVAVLWVFCYVYDLDTSYRILWGMCVVGCMMCFLYKREELGLLSILALYMLLIEIMGSDFASNHGSLPALLAAPIGSMMILNRKRIVFLIAFILAVCTYAVRRGNYADDGPIYAKSSLIDCPKTKYILTTDEKAEAIDNTLKGIKSLVHPGDTLLCFPSAPMMNFLTHTYPVGGTCWPCIPGGSGSFVRPIEGTPKILFNKFSPYGTNWSSKTYTLDRKYGFNLKSFITKHHYKVVFENDYFVLYVSKQNER